MARMFRSARLILSQTSELSRHDDASMDKVLRRLLRDDAMPGIWSQTGPSRKAKKAYDEALEAYRFQAYSSRRQSTRPSRAQITRMHGF